MKRLSCIGLSMTFEPRDLWIGVYWDRAKRRTWHDWTLKIFICIVPMLPITVTFYQQPKT